MTPLLISTISLAAYLLCFWYLYILVMGLYRAHLAKRLSLAATILAVPALFLGYCVDIFSQYTIATLVFLDFPGRKEFLVTDRLKRYLTEGSGARYLKAKWICEHLLDPFDPTGKHC